MEQQEMIDRIFNEDCRLTMKRMYKCVDVVLTSPPYNMTKRKGGFSDSGRYDVYNDFLEESEYLDFTTRLFDDFGRVVKNSGVVIYNFGYSIENPSLPYKLVSDIVRSTEWDVVDTICWKKECGLPFPANKHRLSRNWEFVWVFARKNMLNDFFIDKERSKQRENGQQYYKVYYNFIEAPNNDGETKDLNQATFSSTFAGKILMLYAPTGGVVYDPFMGTGTTAIGCFRCQKDLHYIGSEISESQCKYANNRIREYTSQLTFEF